MTNARKGARGGVCDEEMHCVRQLPWHSDSQIFEFVGDILSTLRTGRGADDQLCNQATGIGDHLLSQCDLFIYMRTSDAFGPYLSTDYILTRLPDHCIRISIGNAYFMSYYPQFIPDNKEPLFAYADQNVIRLLQAGASKEIIIAALSDENYYSAPFLQQYHHDFMLNLRTREAGIDIPLADFIEQNYRRIIYSPRYAIRGSRLSGTWR